MKKIILFALFLLPFANLWCQVNFYIETDTTVYQQNQPIEISFIIHNGTDDTLHLIFPEVPPFFYYIDEVLYDPPAWQVVIDVFIPPDSSHITYILHDQPLSLGIHSIIGGFPYQPPNNNLFTDPIEITVIENVGVEDNTVDLNYSQLYQNSPNPFINSTMISFFTTKSTLLRQDYEEQAEDIKIKIYNIKGQIVRQLSIVPEQSQAPYGAGNNQSSIEWDGKDENGKQLSNGIYFYSLKIGDRIIDTKKCLLFR